MQKRYRNLCCTLLALAFASAAVVSLSPARAQASDTASIQAAAGTEQNATEGAQDFTRRIQNILDNWGKEQNHTAANPLPPSKADDIAPVKEETAPPATPPLAPSAGPPSAPPVFIEPTYNFDWQGTPLSQTLYAIAKISGKRVVINGQLSGTVYTSLQDVTYAQALDYLAKTFNFNWMSDEDGNAILISTSNLMLQSKRYDVHHADKEKIKEELKSLGIDEKSIYVNNEYGSISVTGTPYQLSMAEKRIHEMDQPVPQALIVTQLVEVSHGKDLDLGLQYSLPTYAHTGSSDDSSTDTLHGNWLEKLTFSASAEASKSLSKGKVVARPMIMTLNGQEATVSMGDRVPVLTTTTTSSSTEVTVDYKDVGTTLKVTPFIDEKNNEISMKIDTDISNIAKWIKQSSVSAPQITSRKATTSAHLKSGQSFVIGGLMTSNDLDNLSGIPGLMDLPILGSLFKYHSASKEYTEVFLMVTPYIVSDTIDPKALLQKVEK